MKKRNIVSLVAAAVLMGTAAQGASTATQSLKATAVKAVDVQHQQSIRKALTHHRQKMNAAPKEVLEGLNDTFKAIRALEQNDAKAAQEKLAEATSAFDQALKADPKIDRVPVADDIAITEIASTSEQIDTAVKAAKTALDARRLAEARTLLAPLRDEMVIATQYLPMDLYPSATKLAQKMLKKGHVKAALEALNTALGTLETEEVIIPLPLVRAQSDAEAASKLDKNQKAEAQKLLDAAQQELKKAVALGYSDRHAKAYKSLSDQIEAIRKEIKGKNEVEKLYDKLKTSFETLFHTSENHSAKHTK